MLYVFYGEPFWAREKLSELAARAREKNCEVFRADYASEVPLNSFLSRGLFGGKTFLILENLLEVPEREREIKALASDFSASENIVAVLERELSEEWAECFKNSGAKTQEFKKVTGAKLSSWLGLKAGEMGLKLDRMDSDALLAESTDPVSLLNKLERMHLEKGNIGKSKTKMETEPNYFSFADAVSGRRKEAALLMLRNYIKEGLGAEEAFWKLWWKIKTLRMVDSGMRNHGLHPFVEKKALEHLSNFKSEELKKISSELQDLFSGARRGEENFEEGLEKILLRRI
ncbi:hypothetical protein HYT00_03400 [Candidatus Giovannonibacteria bacterium]|nr:hypothetical protein [Candidatus Giovannonibacteria bacterium]